jgi:hypothetical protein
VVGERKEREKIEEKEKKKNKTGIRKTCSFRGTQYGTCCSRAACGLIAGPTFEIMRPVQQTATINTSSAAVWGGIESSDLKQWRWEIINTQHRLTYSVKLVD